MDFEKNFYFGKIAYRWAIRVSKITGLTLKDIAKKAELSEDVFEKIDNDYNISYQDYEKLRRTMHEIEAMCEPDMTPSDDPDDPRRWTTDEHVAKIELNKCVAIPNVEGGRKRTCIVCKKNLGTYEEFMDPPSDAVYFTSRGNYGSSMFDPFNEFEKIEVYICDDCIKANTDIIEHISGKDGSEKIETLSEQIKRRHVYGYLAKKVQKEIDDK